MFTQINWIPLISINSRVYLKIQNSKNRSLIEPGEKRIPTSSESRLSKAFVVLMESFTKLEATWVPSSSLKQNPRVIIWSLG